MPLLLRIELNGSLRTIYDERLDLRPLGRLQIRRGSHVEPTPAGDWLADLSPVHGPLLGPFSRRSLALAAEREWLEQHWLQRGAPLHSTC